MIQKNGKKTSSNQKTAKVGRKKVTFRSDQLIVKLTKIDKKSLEDMDELERENASFQKRCIKVCDSIKGAEVKRANDKSRRVVLNIPKDSDHKKLISELSKQADVEYAEVDTVDTIQLVIPGDTQYVDQWAHEVVRSERAWDIVTGDESDNVLIGIIDSGISMSAAGALDHADLNSSRYILGTDYVNGGTPRDMNSHGTHVAGIAGAETNNCNGVAGMDWKTKVYICRTLDSNGSGSSSDFADAVEEIVDYALSNGMKAVINYSAGGGDNMTKQDACQYAHDNGMILCAAVGNDNGGSVISPASHSVNFDGVIAVGSTDQNDSVSNFSNVGPEVTVVAPGRNILSTTPTYVVDPTVTTNYDSFNGTSMATPLVTGLIALMWTRKPNMSNVQIRNCLTDSCVKLGAGNFNNNWGFGRVDAYEAVSCINIRRFCFPIFTGFTFFTRFTAFTQLPPVTPFTRFTAFTAFTGRPFLEVEPADAEPKLNKFIKYKNRLFDEEELKLDNIEELSSVSSNLKSIGIHSLDELVCYDLDDLATKVGDKAYALEILKSSHSIIKTL